MILQNLSWEIKEFLDEKFDSSLLQTALVQSIDHNNNTITTNIGTLGIEDNPAATMFLGDLTHQLSKRRVVFVRHKHNNDNILTRFIKRS